jgi:K+/H+ antiporter YhaU regulatory subunit KhtT
MVDEKIKLKTENGQIIEVVVLSKNANRIEVVLGEGVHNVRAALTPTRNEMAYVGTIMGREIVYERSRAQVQGDIDRLDPRLKKSR